MALQDKIKSLKKEVTDALSVLQLDELKSRKRVLRRMGFIDDADVVQIKARVACEISTGDELVLSELLFNRFFNELTPEQCAACLSCFIFEEKCKEPKPLSEDLAKPFREIQAQARIVAKISQESKLTLNEEEYLATFKSDLMSVVYMWSKGASFAEIWSVHMSPCHFTNFTDIRTARRPMSLRAVSSASLGDWKSCFASALKPLKSWAARSSSRSSPKRST